MTNVKVETLYSCKSIRRGSTTDAVVIHCGDQRFQAAFHEFLTDGLNLGSYALLAVPGGGHFLSAELFLPKFARVELQSLRFLVKRSGARRILLLGHEDCLFFKERLQFFFAEEQMNHKQFANLVKARSVLCERFPGSKVEVYFADSDAGESIKFLKID